MFGRDRNRDRVQHVSMDVAWNAGGGNCGSAAGGGFGVLFCEHLPVAFVISLTENKRIQNLWSDSISGHSRITW